jgi:hypothetical protein
MSKFYGAFHSFPFTSNIRDGFPISLVLARTRTQTYTNACNRARARDLLAITQACILVIAHYLSFYLFIFLLIYVFIYSFNRLFIY